MSWKRGPLPKGTYGYGGVVTSDMVTVEQALAGESPNGFCFADFGGDSVKLVGPGRPDNEVVPADKVVFWNNDLTVPVKAEE